MYIGVGFLILLLFFFLSSSESSSCASTPIESISTPYRQTTSSSKVFIVKRNIVKDHQWRAGRTQMPLSGIAFALRPEKGVEVPNPDELSPSPSPEGTVPNPHHG